MTNATLNQKLISSAYSNISNAENQLTFSFSSFFFYSNTTQKQKQGGFARCYEIVDLQSQDVYAAKVVSKKLVMKHNQKDKMTQEIKIHQSLNHPNVVKFLSFFEDDRNVYIVFKSNFNAITIFRGS